MAVVISSVRLFAALALVCVILAYALSQPILIPVAVVLICFALLV